jgi:hypothetical protein
MQALIQAAKQAGFEDPSGAAEAPAVVVWALRAYSSDADIVEAALQGTALVTEHPSYRRLWQGMCAACGTEPLRSLTGWYFW